MKLHIYIYIYITQIEAQEIHNKTTNLEERRNLPLLTAYRFKHTYIQIKTQREVSCQFILRSLFYVTAAHNSTWNFLIHR